MYPDKNGFSIEEGDIVRYANGFYDVEVNVFTGKLVIDNEEGQVNLEDVHNECVLMLGE